MLLASSLCLLAACSSEPPEEATATAPPVKAAPEPEPLPSLGARVRVVVPNLGSGWRTGIFVRTSQQPPCYMVTLTDPTSNRRIAARVNIGAVSKMQRSTMYTGVGTADPDPGAAAHDGESWHDISPDALKNVRSSSCS